MDSRKRFAPRTKRQSQNPITRSHDTFYRGSMPETIDSEISGSTEKVISNFLTKGSYLESRTGSTQWTNTSLPNTLMYNEVEVYGDAGGQTILMIVPFDADGTLQYNLGAVEGTKVGVTIKGEYYILTVNSAEYAGPYEFILTVEGIGEQVHSFTTTIEVIPPIQSILYNEKNNKWHIVIGGSVYISTDETCDTYTSPIFIGDVAYGSEEGPVVELSGEKITMVTYGDDVYVGTSSGIYIIDYSNNYMWKINTSNPYDSLDETSTGAIEDSLFQRNMLYTYTRLKESGERTDIGNKMLWESGANQWEVDRDYSTLWSDSEETWQDNVVSGFKISNPDNEKTPSYQATHFSLYLTRNVDIEEGIEKFGNNSEEYFWAVDIPVAAMFNVEVTTIITEGSVYVVDVLTDTSTFGTNISQIPVKGGVEGPGNISKSAPDSDLDTLTINRTLTVGDIITVSYGVGVISPVTSVSSGVVTVSDSLGFKVGEQFIVNSGDDASRLGVITSVVTSTSFTYSVDGDSIAVGDNIAISTGVIDNEPIPVLGDAVGFKVDISEKVLLDRKLLHTLPTRIMEPMANGNLVSRQGGFFFAANYDETEYNYCQILGTREYTIGCHNRGVQYDTTDTPIRAFVRFKDSMSIFCNNKTFGVATNSISEAGDIASGRFVSIIPSPTILSDSIGIRKDYHVTKGLNDVAYVITTEPGVREFNGSSFGEDKSVGRLSETLRDRVENVGISYIPNYGVLVRTGVEQ